MTWREVHGWFDFPSIYDEAVKKATNKSIFVEVGVAYGKSINYLASASKEAGKSPKIYAVDSFKGTTGERPGTYSKNMFELFVQNVHLCLNNDIIETIVGDSTDSASKFKDGSCDLIFIDAAHDYASVKKDLLAWMPKLKKGGIFAGHDIDARGVHRAVEEVLGVGGFEIVGRSWVKI
jgi:predicted O-methyltransferase YrrM